MGCGTNTFPDGWVVLMMSSLQEQLDNPTGIWADLNIVYRMWRLEQLFISQGLICAADYPDPPDPDDYPDLVSEATLTDLLYEIDYHCGADSDMI